MYPFRIATTKGRSFVKTTTAFKTPLEVDNNRSSLVLFSAHSVAHVNGRAQFSHMRLFTSYVTVSALITHRMRRLFVFCVLARGQNFKEGFISYELLSFINWRLNV